jgi:hypothetical protein
MPTLGQLSKERLSRELNDVSTVLYTSARRQEAINDAVEDFADQTECWMRQATISLSCSVTEYSVLSSGVIGGSTDYVRLAAQGVEYLHASSNGRVTQMAGDDFPERPIQFQNRVSPGWRGSTTPVMTPSAWYRRADGGDLFLGLYEPPKVGSSETASLIVPYVARPEPMTSTSVEPFTLNSTVRTDLRAYHRAFPHFAASRLLGLIGDTQGAAQQLAYYQVYVERYKADRRPKGGQYVTFATNYLQRARGVPDDANRVPGWTWR